MNGCKSSLKGLIVNRYHRIVFSEYMWLKSLHIILQYVASIYKNNSKFEISITVFSNYFAEDSAYFGGSRHLKKILSAFRNVNIDSQREQSLHFTLLICILEFRHSSAN